MLEKVGLPIKAYLDDKVEDVTNTADASVYTTR